MCTHQKTMHMMFCNHIPSVCVHVCVCVRASSCFCDCLTVHHCSSANNFAEALHFIFFALNQNLKRTEQNRIRSYSWYWLLTSVSLCTMLCKIAWLGSLSWANWTGQSWSKHKDKTLLYSLFLCRFWLIIGGCMRNNKENMQRSNM